MIRAKELDKARKAAAKMEKSERKNGALYHGNRRRRQFQQSPSARFRRDVL